LTGLDLHQLDSNKRFRQLILVPPLPRFPSAISHFVTSMTAPIASGWSDSRVGLSPTGKTPPLHGARQFQTYIDNQRRTDV
jgi:hypothetical protein